MDHYGQMCVAKNHMIDDLKRAIIYYLKNTTILSESDCTRFINKFVIKKEYSICGYTFGGRNEMIKEAKEKIQTFIDILKAEQQNQNRAKRRTVRAKIMSKKVELPHNLIDKIVIMSIEYS